MIKHFFSLSVSILSLILVLNGSSAIAIPKKQESLHFHRPANQLLGPQASITRKLVIKGQPDYQLKTQHLKAHPLIADAVESQGLSLSN